jgi:hypothetical protein
MRLRIGHILLAVLAFAVALLWRLPLRWALPFVPANIHCSAPAGSLWKGRCGDLSLAAPGGALPVGPVSWQLAPAALLKGRLAGHAQVAGPLLQGRARFSAGLGRTLELQDLDATLPLDRRLLPMVPANWTGRVNVRVPQLKIVAGRLESVAGDIEARDIVAQGSRPDDFGSYALHVPAAAPGQVHRGELRDLGGPLELAGAVVMQPDLSWQVDAQLSARPAASADLRRLIEFLGPPDAQGRRPFSVAGDFH